MDGGHGANQLALPGPAHALALLAAAATGGASHWGMLALQAAHNPHVQHAVQESQRIAVDAAWQSAKWINEPSVVPGHYSFRMVCVVVAASLLVAAVVFCAWIGSVAAAGGGAWWLARRERYHHDRVAATSNGHLQALANFISTGGEPAIQETATQLGVSCEAVRTWWIHWQLAQCGPQRTQ